MPCFPYGEAEIRHLKDRDPVLGAAADAIGPVRRQVIPDLFEALVHSIIGQQISTKAHITVWQRLKSSLGAVTPQRVLALSEDVLRGFGISLRKIRYIQNAAEKVLSRQLDIQALKLLPDEEVCRELTALSGVGVWTAEMLMIFSLQRPDILSFGDLGIQRGLRMLYGLPSVSRSAFDVYRRRYSPYASVASLYLWAIAAGALPALADPAKDKLMEG